MKPHKHAELIKAWADGAEIQYKDELGEWETWDGYNAPPWYPDEEYRIKPEPKPDVPEGLIDPKSYYQGFEDGKNSVLKPEPKPDYYTKHIAYKARIYSEGDRHPPAMPNLKLCFDGETGELKAAEVIK